MKMYGKWKNKEERDNDAGYKRKKELAKKVVPAHYRRNTRSEGGVPFGMAPKGEK